MVRGKKSIPSRTDLAAFAVVRTVVLLLESSLWMTATTAPWLCCASLPVSNEMVLVVPATGAETFLASAIGYLLVRDAYSSATWFVEPTDSQFPVVEHPPGHPAGDEAGGPQLAADLPW